MPIGTTFRNDLEKLIFNGIAIANVADNAATAPLTTLKVALHTADPNAGDQNTNAAAYTGYAQASVTRDSSGWTVSGNTVSPAATISFPAGTGGGETITHASIGDGTKIFFSGTLSPNITTGDGVTPEIKTTSTITLT